MSSKANRVMKKTQVLVPDISPDPQLGPIPTETQPADACETADCSRIPIFLLVVGGRSQQVCRRCGLAALPKERQIAPPIRALAEASRAFEALDQELRDRTYPAALLWKHLGWTAEEYGRLMQRPSQLQLHQLLAVLHILGSDPKKFFRTLFAAQPAAAAKPSPADPAVVVRRKRRAPGKLSPRQREVVSLVGEGLTNSQIAQQLNLSVATVKSHMQAIYAELGVRRRALAVAVANGEAPLPQAAQKEEQVRLAPRQLSILRMVAQGLSNREIAELLDCSYHTVKNHLNSIYSLIGAQGRRHAVVVARRHGWIG